MTVSFLRKIFLLWIALSFSLTTVFAATPPGLTKSNQFPHGLENKTPPGWSKGKKTGWYKTHPKPVKAPVPKIKLD